MSNNFILINLFDRVLFMLMYDFVYDISKNVILGVIHKEYFAYFFPYFQLFTDWESVHYYFLVKSDNENTYTEDECDFFNSSTNVSRLMRSYSEGNLSNIRKLKTTRTRHHRKNRPSVEHNVLHSSNDCTGNNNIVININYWLFRRRSSCIFKVIRL